MVCRAFGKHTAGRVSAFYPDLSGSRASASVSGSAYGAEGSLLQKAACAVRGVGASEEGQDREYCTGVLCRFQQQKQAVYYILFSDY